MIDIPFLDVIFQRSPDLHYVSPAVCENDFSSTSEPAIFIEPFERFHWTSGPLWYYDSEGKRHLWWGTEPGVVCYNVYRLVGGNYELQDECVPAETPYDIPDDVPDPETYRVTAITEDGGETRLDDSITPVLSGSCPAITGYSPAVGLPVEIAGGAEFTLSVTAVGTPNLLYRFFHETTLVQSGYVPSFTKTMEDTDAGNWHVEVANTVPGCLADVGENWIIEYEPLDLITTDVDTACINESYSFTFDADGGTPFEGGLYLWTITGDLPNGLTLNEDTGEISGTPTEGGSFPILVKVTDAIGDFIEEPFAVNVVEITTASPISDGINAEVYNGLLEAAPAPIEWTLTGGALPTGLTLNSDGTITGTPTECGDFSFEATATPTGADTGCSKNFSLKVWEADNTLIGVYGVSGVGDYPWTNVTPGVYRIEIRSPLIGDPGYPNWYGTPFLFANVGYLPGCNTGDKFYNAATLGGTDGDCTGVDPVILKLDGNPYGVIYGSTRTGVDFATATTAVRADLVAQGELARFTTENPLTSVGASWAGYATPDCNGHSCVSNYDGGGSGMQYRLIRIGKPC